MPFSVLDAGSYPQFTALSARGRLEKTYRGRLAGRRRAGFTPVNPKFNPKLDVALILHV